MSAPPRVWLVVGDKLGDNAQVEIVAEALGWPCERKTLRFKPAYVTGKPRFGASLRHVDLRDSASLAPPWPDLILTVGRRPAMAALWVKRQSGGRSRLAMVGRPRGRSEEVDLYLVSSQYRVPPAANVLRLALPLQRSRSEAVAQAAAHWRPRLDALARPLTALLVGGRTFPYRFDAAVARDLLARAAAKAEGGTLYVTTSRRTPPAVAETLARHLPAGAELFRWRTEAAADNPYLALIGLADRFIVTADSVSMLVETARTGKPLLIYPLPKGRGALDRLWRGGAQALHPLRAASRGAPGPLGRALLLSGLITYPRDLGGLHARLREQAGAAGIDEPWPSAPRPPADELPAVVARLRALFPADQEID